MKVEIQPVTAMKIVGLFLVVCLTGCATADMLEDENPELPGPDDDPADRGSNCPSLSGPVAFHFDRSDVAATPGLFVASTPMVAAQNCAGSLDLYLRAAPAPFNGQFSFGRFAIDPVAPLESCGLCAAFSTDEGPLFRATGGSVDIFSLSGTFFVTLSGLSLGELDPQTGGLLPGGRSMRAGGTISVRL